ncbi:hypothetical protein [Actinoplanes sp. NPDC026670]|uniref:hypothetical protein n=1 Tax=Actinoplanes sp. NPDC026670 TaxID=3154700 RepID=UPI003409A246
MDLWDLTRLLLRRWYFAVPMLVATVAVVFLAAQSVSPDYKAMGYVQIIPAQSTGKEAEPNAKPRPQNPWLDLGYAALGNAVSLTVTDPTALEKLAEQGYSDSVTVLLNERTPLFEIEVVGDSKQQASSTVQKVIELLQKDVAAKQEQYGVQKQDTITTFVINDGSNPVQDGGTRKRVLIVAGGLGVLLTTACTIALDYWLRRRARLKDGGDDKPGGKAAGSAVAGLAPSAMPDPAEQTQVIRPQPTPNGKSYNGDNNRRMEQPQERKQQRPVSGASPRSDAPVDATVVLPSPNFQTRRHQGRSQ